MDRVNGSEDELKSSNAFKMAKEDFHRYLAYGENILKEIGMGCKNITKKLI